MRKEIQKKGKGIGAAGPTRFPFGPAGQRSPLPLPSLPRARRPPRSTRCWPRGGRTPALDAPRPATSTTLVGTPPCAPRPLPLFCHLPPPLSSSTPRKRSSSSSFAGAIAAESSAARRWSHQSSNLDAKSTSALAVAAVSPCVRSTEVRSSRAP